MNVIAKDHKKIYNVYHKGGSEMKKAKIAQWGNSLGIRIPITITKTLNLKAGDQVDFELKENGIFLKTKQSTMQMFEEFYGKPYNELTSEDIGDAEEMDWGEDVGGEIL